MRVINIWVTFEIIGLNIKDYTRFWKKNSGKETVNIGMRNKLLTGYEKGNVEHIMCVAFSEIRVLTSFCHTEHGSILIFQYLGRFYLIGLTLIKLLE